MQGAVFTNPASVTELPRRVGRPLEEIKIGLRPLESIGPPREVLSRRWTASVDAVASANRMGP